MANPSATREQILTTAATLFFRDGFRAVGVDTIVAESGVAKMTLYRHFPSKDDLIVAYLEDTNKKFWVWFDKAIAPYPDQPREQILAFFRSLEELITKPACYGCPFLIAATEFPNVNEPAHQVALANKNAVRQRFQDLLTQANIHPADILADHLSLLVDGAFIAVRMYGYENPARHVSQAAQQLIHAYADQ